MVNFNGNLIPQEEAKLSITNRGYSYGDSLFETIRVLNGKVIFWEDHYFRLMSSMRILRMDIPMAFSPEYLETQIKETVQSKSLTNARVKLQVHRKEGGLYSPKDRGIEFIIMATELKETFYMGEDQAYEIELFKDHYLTSGLLSSIKSNNKLISILGSIYAEENDYANCLLINENKSVVEALNGNLFLVKGNVIKTPPISDGCLNGVTRKQLINIIGKLEDYTLEEASISPFELQKADELFITNVIVGIQSITKYRKKEFKNTTAKSILGKLNAHARLS